MGFNSGFKGLMFTYSWAFGSLLLQATLDLHIATIYGGVRAATA